ncbi:hypothetical protein BLNAU_11634 [Blattamonas nauphoetae]|uniref:Uncharacterized protein n=1 Tax=Blattamonas nauphoetae TaxID=2049346 RepID=A0ABQ9XR36_9EUKA|nr:hypothetical protein BLNAU_11634 [Blattamonas nauphoetae]
MNTVDGVWKLREEEQAKRVAAQREKVKMKEEKRKAEERARKAEREKRRAEAKLKKAEGPNEQADTEKGKQKKTENEREGMEEEKKKAEQQKEQLEREKEKLSDEVKKTRAELGELRAMIGQSERGKSEMAELIELRLRLAGLPIWVGPESLQTFDRTAHTLTPTSLKQTIVTSGDDPWRTAYTLPIDEGEWELKITARETTFSNVMLGFLRYPLPEDAIHCHCGCYLSGIGGDFTLSSGKMTTAGKVFKPEGTNKKCDEFGQTAAIRVNMRTREARLFVDEEEQPGIFPNIPSPLCIGITTGGDTKSVEVVWLKNLRENDEQARFVLEEKRTLKSDFEKLKQQLTNLPIWVGTESIQTLDRTAHSLTPTTLTQIVKLESGGNWRNAFTLPIDEGEWELKISYTKESGTMLGFVRYPLPEDATKRSCGFHDNGIGGDFVLWDGRMWRSNETFKPAGTNKVCDRVGQTAAIRVNMRTRDARLFVDEEEQPGIFTDIPSPLCIGITTGFLSENQSVEVVWLKRLRGNDELEQSALEERRTLKSENAKLKQQLTNLPIWVGTESLQTLDTSFHSLTPTTITQPKKLEKGFRTAFTHPIDEGEWELKISASVNSFWNMRVFFSLLILSDLGFLKHPLSKVATQRSCGYWSNGIGGGFTLGDGTMYKSNEMFKPAGTNKVCDRVGQTAAIRVNMRTREAQLFVDEEEQPGIFTDIPSPLCLGITTGCTKDNQSVEVLWLKRLRG